MLFAAAVSSANLERGKEVEMQPTLSIPHDALARLRMLTHDQTKQKNAKTVRKLKEKHLSSTQSRVPCYATRSENKPS